MTAVPSETRTQVIIGPWGGIVWNGSHLEGEREWMIKHSGYVYSVTGALSHTSSPGLLKLLWESHEVLFWGLFFFFFSKPTHTLSCQGGIITRPLKIRELSGLSKNHFSVFHRHLLKGLFGLWERLYCHATNVALCFEDFLLLKWQVTCLEEILSLSSSLKTAHEMQRFSNCFLRVFC